MTLEDRLKYCKVCKNRGFDIKSGILCNLTQEKPQFEETCDTYDENEYERRRQKEYLLNERLSSRANRYSTFPWLVSLVGGFLPNEFKIKNLSLMQSEDLVIARLDKQGIRITNQEKILWDNVQIVYVHTEMNFINPELYLVLELLNKKEAIKIAINHTLGSMIILTFVEAYREKCNS